MSGEQVTWEPDWICTCLNSVGDYGFYPCTPDGKEADPTSPRWEALPLFRCCQCGEIVNAATKETVVTGATEVGQ